MWSLLERAKKVILALVLSIIPLVLLYAQSKDEEIRRILSWPLTEVIGSIETGSLAVTGYVSDVFYRYFYLVNRSDELLELRALVLETNSLRSQVAELLNERASIVKLYFQSVDAKLPKSSLARVIARAGGPMARMIRLNKGSADGILPKSPVVAHEGVVGQVLTVAPHFCDVLLITDASFALEAKVVDSEVRGLLRGITTSSEYLMEIRDLDTLADIQPGNVISTSGLNSNFPAGIPIGTVSEASKSRDGLYVFAKVKPFVKVDRLSYVLVLDARHTEMIEEVDALTAAWPMAIQ